MSSLKKILSILDLFTVDQPVWTAEQIMSHLQCSRPQSYRYIRELFNSGFIVRLHDGYSLGPRCIELDYIIRRSDVLLHDSEGTIREVRDQTGCDVLLANIYGDRIVAVHHERGADAKNVGFGRGRSMPLFRGAGSKVILASLPPARQKRLFELFLKEDKGSLGGTWEDCRASLRQIRRDGYAVSLGELEIANVGVAAPVVYNLAVPSAALVLVMSRLRYGTTDRTLVTHVVKDAAKRISTKFLQQPIPLRPDIARA